MIKDNLWKMIDNNNEEDNNIQNEEDSITTKSDGWKEINEEGDSKNSNKS